MGAGMQIGATVKMSQQNKKYKYELETERALQKAAGQRIAATLKRQLQPSISSIVQNNTAATKIQTAFRNKKAKQIVNDMLVQKDIQNIIIPSIQSAVRGKIARKKVQQLKQEKQKDIPSSKIGKVIRGKVIRSKVKPLIENYKKEVKDIEKDKLLEIQKANDNIEYERSIIAKNKIGLVGSLFTDKQSKQYKEKIVDDANRNIKAEELRIKNIEKQTEKRKQRVKEVLQQKIEVDTETKQLLNERLGYLLLSQYTKYKNKPIKTITETSFRNPDYINAYLLFLLDYSESKSLHSINYYQSVLLETYRIAKLIDPNIIYNKSFNFSSYEPNYYIYLKKYDDRYKYSNYIYYFNDINRNIINTFYNKYKDYRMEISEPLLKQIPKTITKDTLINYLLTNITADVKKEQQKLLTRFKESNYYQIYLEIKDIYSGKAPKQEKNIYSGKNYNKWDTSPIEIAKVDEKIEEKVIEDKIKLDDVSKKAEKDLRTSIDKEAKIQKELAKKAEQKALEVKTILENKLKKSILNTIDRKETEDTIKEVAKVVKIEKEKIDKIEKEKRKLIEESRKRELQIQSEKKKKEEELKTLKSFLPYVNTINDTILELDTIDINKTAKRYNKLTELVKFYNNLLSVFTTNKNEMSSNHKEDIKGILEKTKNRINEEQRIIRSINEKNIRYTREELDAMSMTEIEKLLIYTDDGTKVIAPVSGETSQRDRDIYNAWQRKLRKQSK